MKKRPKRHTMARLVRASARIAPITKLLRSIKKTKDAPTWFDDEMRPAFNEVLKGLRRGKTFTVVVGLRRKVRFRGKIMFGAIYLNPRTGELYRFTPSGDKNRCHVTWLVQLRHPGIRRGDEPLEIGTPYAEGSATPEGRGGKGREK